MGRGYRSIFASFCSTIMYSVVSQLWYITLKIDSKCKLSFGQRSAHLQMQTLEPHLRPNSFAYELLSNTVQ